MITKIEPNPLNLKVGDYVTAYKKGIWKITKIEKRFLKQEDLKYSAYSNMNVGDEYKSLVELEQYSNELGQLKKGNSSCDISFCEPLSKHIENLGKQRIDIELAIEHFSKLLNK